MDRYCGKTWTSEDIENVRNLISTYPTATRFALSHLVCEKFNWRKPDGKLKDMSCRVAMIKMHRDGLIELPAPRHAKSKPYQLVISKDCDPAPEICCSVNELSNLSVELVPRGAALSQWNQFVARYHYLGYKMLPGAQLRYFIKDGERVLGAMGFGAAAWKVAARDNFIGWDKDLRENRLHLIVNQARFLILPWVHCKNLASKALAIVTARLADDWEQRYNYRPVLMETFVEVARFHGTCYKASNWLMVGQTQGRGKLDRFHTHNQAIKTIWLKPLIRNFRHELGVQK